ncbi:MAG: hypothetical protein KC609_17465 [Myxococcales bacterium]|nr:hypothetical protein [Myxococcales bacterium]
MSTVHRGRYGLILDSALLSAILHRKGLSVNEIAACRNLHPRTVRQHLSSEKPDASAVAARCRRRGDT